MPMPTTTTEFTAAELRAEVARQALTQQQVAERMGEGQWWVSRRLTGDAQITVDDLVRFAAALQIPVTQLLPATERAA